MSTEPFPKQGNIEEQRKSIVRKGLWHQPRHEEPVALRTSDLNWRSKNWQGIPLTDRALMELYNIYKYVNFIYKHFLRGYGFFRSIRESSTFLK
jgi:hypothetical protein